MKVFMLGWEFPPHISGGLGTACHGMTRGLDEIGVDVCFILPKPIPVDASSHVRLRSPQDLRGGRGPAAAPEAGAAEVEPPQRIWEHVELRRIAAALQAYGTVNSYEDAIRRLRAAGVATASADAPRDLDSEELTALLGPEAAHAVAPSRALGTGAGADYSGDLLAQVQRYAMLAVELARREQFDVVHAHDWMTYPAGLAVAAATGKPLVVHVHSTEFDRSGENVNQQVYDIERTGMHGAARVICVSYWTARIVTSRYGVPADRVDVVYNAVETPNGQDLEARPIGTDEKIVLFLGRVTMQKGPEYFLQAAKKVVERYPNVRFVVAGSGDMMRSCVKLVADLKLGRYVTFTGFLRGDDVQRIFRMADLYVMPSVSEPFGIAPLEALSHDVPVIISKQSGVSEVLQHVLKVDFWDVDEMTNKILGVLRHEPLQHALREHGRVELRKFSWTDSARKLRDVYARAIRQAG